MSKPRQLTRSLVALNLTRAPRCVDALMLTNVLRQTRRFHLPRDFEPTERHRITDTAEAGLYNPRSLRVRHEQLRYSRAVVFKILGRLHGATDALTVPRGTGLNPSYN